MNKEFWENIYYLPMQEEITLLEEGIEEINPAEAFRKQAQAINASGPLYAELEYLEARLERVDRVLKELRSRILAQNMPVSSSSTRTTDLVDAFILDCSTRFKMPDGHIRDVSEHLIKIERRKSKILYQIEKVSKRLKAIEAMAEKCDRILNWVKHEYRTGVRV